MKNKYTPGFLLLVFAAFFTSCESDKVNYTAEYYSPEEYATLRTTLDLPSTPLNYTGQGFFAQNNSVTTLGRVLFYDTRLSQDNTVSCASCHQQQLAFADDVAFSTGIMNRSTERNSLALGAFRNFGDYSGDQMTTLFWDGRVDNLHDQMRQTIANPNEMGMEMDEVVAKIRNLEFYRILTEKAYGIETLSTNLVLDALEAFMNSIQSTDSRFDQAAPEFATSSGSINPWQGLTIEENKGKTIFMNNCVQCHQQGLENILIAHEPVRSANNGLDLVYTDKGHGEVDNAPGAVGVFKVPALKNIELTAPYMHDGRFSTLEEVVNFYSSGIQNHTNLHPLLKSNNQAKKFNFSESDKQALVLFLKTMTDHVMIQNEKWSDPFF